MGPLQIIYTIYNGIDVIWMFGWSLQGWTELTGKTCEVDILNASDSWKPYTYTRYFLLRGETGQIFFRNMTYHICFGEGKSYVDLDKREGGQLG